MSCGVHCLHRRWSSLRVPVALILCCLLLLFSARTVSRNTVWSTREALFRSVTHRHVHHRVISLLILVVSCRSALVTVPNNAKVHFNYANFLKDGGRRPEAIQFYRTAIRCVCGGGGGGGGCYIQLGGKSICAATKRRDWGIPPPPDTGVSVVF